MKLAGGERVLDVGSGLGQLTRAMARQAGRGAVGVERSLEQLAEARRLAVAAGENEQVDFRTGDATKLPLRDDEWGTFDVAHTRFLLEHVPDPLAVVRNMVRAVRIGGRVILEDDDHGIMRLWPEPPGYGPLWEAYIRVYDRMGNDPYVGRRLVWLLHQAGASPVRNTWPFFGSCAGHPHFAAYIENMIKLLLGAREQMLTYALIDLPSFDLGIDGLHDWRKRPDAAMWFAFAWAEGVRRE